MAYQALYRKYRPQLFADVLGQEHITTTLKNQVESGRVSHAYVFSGSRGTGKTTTAKILARAVNCAHPVNGEPCGECEYCLAAADSADIIELDAASNNGVDDVRAIIDKARFTPLKLKKKVYIIDEAHMLSRPAFNALLKTLEEPPEHVLFILATTEPQSIPATILSRCQRFDFHRIGVEDIISCVRSAVNKAGAEIDDEGLLVIARAAEGGMRDALSIADQCIAFCGNKVSARDIYGVLGGMDSSFLFTTADALINGDAALAVRSLDSVIEQGRDMGVFAADMAKHFRALLIAKLCGRSEDILNCTPDTMARYIEQASRCGETRLRSAVDALMDAVSGMRYLSLPRVRLESAFIRIASPDKAAEADANGLMERLEAMETKLAAIEKGGFTRADADGRTAADHCAPTGGDCARKAAARGQTAAVQRQGIVGNGAQGNTNKESNACGAGHEVRMPNRGRRAVCPLPEAHHCGCVHEAGNAEGCAGRAERRGKRHEHTLRRGGNEERIRGGKGKEGFRPDDRDS